MGDHAKTVKQLRYCSKATVKDCMECEGYKETGGCASERLAKEAADAIEELSAFDIRNLPEGLYTVKNGVVYMAKVKVSGGNVLNMKTGESHWEDDRIVGGEQVFPRLPKKGKWSVQCDPDDKPLFHRKYVCSVCGKWNTYGLSDYCPRCGAEMERGEAEI